MKKILMSLIPCYVVQNNSFIGPYVSKVTSVNVNYGVYSLILDNHQKIQLTGNKVYFTRFFAQREVRRIEQEIADRLQKYELTRKLREDDATEL